MIIHNSDSNVTYQPFKPYSKKPIIIKSLTPHGPITIIHDDNFTDYGLPGLGTEEEPYRIEDLDITTTGDYSISITSTTEYFTIQNCYLEATNMGIKIDTVASDTCTIFNNTCMNNGADGIYIRQSNYVNLTRNNCSLNGRNGIYVDFYSDFALVDNNTCNNNNGDGIYFYAASNFGQVFNNTCNYNTIYGICITTSSSCEIIQNKCQYNYYGIFLHGLITADYCVNCLVVNNKIIGNSFAGIVLLSKHTTIENNTIWDNGMGVYLFDSNDITVLENDIIVKDSLPYILAGIVVFQSSQSILLNNTCTALSNVFDEKTGISIESSTSISLENNLCFLLRNGITTTDSSEISIFNNICFDNLDYGISVTNTNSATLSNNICYNNSVAISLEGSDSANINSNICYDNHYGIIFKFSGDSQIQDNTCYNNYAGINLFEISNSLTDSNNCSYNSFGFEIRNSDSLVISNNLCYSQGWGMYLDDITNSIIEQNNITKNSQAGISMWDVRFSIIRRNMFEDNSAGIRIYKHDYVEGFYYNTIVLNTFYKNTYGMTITGVVGATQGPVQDINIVINNIFEENDDYAIFIDNSKWNSIFLNTFLSNNLMGGGSQACDDGYQNNWYSSYYGEGNFWNDYSGSGNYIIDGTANAEDLYPLTEMPVEDALYEDPDGDGLTNLEEYWYGTDPTNPDMDGDGLSDKEEVIDYGTDPDDEDSDDDGYSDYEEVQEGTDPLDPDDYPEEEPTPEPTVSSNFRVIGFLLCVALLGCIQLKRKRNQN